MKSQISTSFEVHWESGLQPLALCSYKTNQPLTILYFSKIQIYLLLHTFQFLQNLKQTPSSTSF